MQMNELCPIPDHQRTSSNPRARTLSQPATAISRSTIRGSAMVASLVAMKA